jgi:hypothetical protein
MDILNFISWIRGGRKFTNVDPATTLVPVGVRDNRRDDKYLTGGISVEDLAAQIGGGSIEIPKLVARIQYGTVLFNLDFYQTDAWKALNPRIFLYRMAPQKRKQTAGGTVQMPRTFVHPSNTAGVQPGGKWWTGTQTIQAVIGTGSPLIRHTEFAIPTTVPYQSFTLPDLSPYEWMVYVNTVTEEYRQCTSADFPIPQTAVGTDTNSNGFYVRPFNSRKADMFPTSSRGAGSSKMKVKFRFAIVIDNPNATPDAPYLIGPMSENVTVKFFGEGSDIHFAPDYVNRLSL